MEWRGLRKDEDIKKDKTSGEQSGVRLPTIRLSSYNYIRYGYTLNPLHNHGTHLTITQSIQIRLNYST